MIKTYVSFVEEGIMNPQYYGYVGGRIEVRRPEDHWASEEIRFFTNRLDEFYAFRELWDGEDVTNKELAIIRKIIKKEFCEEVK